MRHIGILFALGILGLMCAACEPLPQPPVAGGKGGSKLATCTFDRTRVVELATPFIPAVYSNCVAKHLDNPAACSGPTGTSNALPAIYANTIQAAFDGGSDQFKRAMCTVDKFFIATGPLPLRNWGMRVPNDADPSQIKRFIGLSHLAFSGTYSAGEKEILKIISFIPNSSFSRVNVSAYPDTLEMKIRAILAHEMAHILWWDYRNSILSPPSTCGNFFLTWATTPINPPPRGYHDFAVEISGNTPIEGYRLFDVMRDNASGNFAKLDQIYDDGNWVGLFSFIAPDEDFAETYKLWVLTNSGLTSLQTTIPTNSSANDTEDVVQYLSNTNSSLYNKVQWIANPNCLPVP